MSQDFAFETEVKPRDVLIADGDFTCIEEGARLTVKVDDDNLLYVDCSEGRHYLDGQLDERGYYVGLYPAPAPAGDEA